MNDIEIIKKLNQQHGWGLKQVDNITAEGYFVSDNGLLTGLNLSNIHLTDIGFISKLKNLTHLTLVQIFIRDITPIKNLTNLIELVLNDNAIDNLEALQDLTNLERLELYNNRISDIRPLANLTKLKILVLAINQIDDITPLSKLTNLWHLKIYNNKISDLKPLENLKNLTMLGINNNLISDISVLAQLHKLETIVILDNNISDISPLKNLNKLKRLDLQSNKISELSVWITNFNMDIGFNDSHGELDLNYNPITKPPINIVSQGKEAIKHYFEDAGVSQETLNDEENIILGKKSKIERESTQKVINVEKYARVLAKLFKNAKGEFNFGLFGAWGRGKTFLIKEVKEILIKDNYEVVIFDAWKYKKQPQVWAHLYEVCVEQFLKKPKSQNAIIHLLNTEALKLRYGIIKKGYNKIIWAFIILIIGFLNHCVFKEISLIIDMLGGLTASIISAYLIYKIGSSFNNFREIIVKKYTDISSHKRELGLQDVIGKDLKYILTALANKNKNIAYKIAISVLSIVTLISVYFFIDNISAKQILSTLSLPEIAIWFKWLVLTVIAIFLALLNTLIWWNIGKITCIVIDNLDRCESSEMLEIIESVRLLLEDEELLEILRTVMLIDEDKLRYAIAEKYSHHITMNKPKSTEIDSGKKGIEINHSIVNEQINKLFISYLRLSDLTKKETIEITTSVLREYALLEKEVPSIPEKKSNGIEHSSESKTNRDGKNISIIENKLPKQEKDDSSNKPNDIYFSEEEKQQIIRSIQEIYDAEPTLVNPRFIRSFTFKYFLARDLFNELHINADNCISLLEEAICRKSENIKNDTPAITNAKMIIKQVV